jgi:uncharacterized membrane protein
LLAFGRFQPNLFSYCRVVTEAASMTSSIRKQKPAHWQDIGKSAEEILNVRHEIATHSGRAARITGRIGEVLATPTFFFALLALHLGWILLNLPGLPWRPWDPYPFTLLATIASAEAPFLTVLVLMHQQREQHINELREEISLQVSLHVERQSTMLIRLLCELHNQAGLKSEQDSEVVDRMQNYLDPKHLLDNLRRDLQSEEGGSSSSKL